MTRRNQSMNAASPPTRRPPRKRRLGLGMAVLAVVAIVLISIQWYRGHEVVRSCTGNGGNWDAERQACTFGGSGQSPSSSTPAPPEPAPQ